MSMAMKCDRCGKLFEKNKGLNASEFDQDWWRYSIRKDNHPYEETKIDLCESCQRALDDWIKQGGKTNDK